MVEESGRGVAVPDVPPGGTSRTSRTSRTDDTGGTGRVRRAFSRWNRNKGRPLPPIRPWPRRQWPLLVVLAGILVSLVVVLFVDFRPGTVLFAVSVLLAAAFRLVLTTRRAGLLVLRSRSIDVVTLTVMGAVALLLALAIPDIR